MTIHLELDIEEDIESKMAELDRLRRLGRFREADAYLQNNLSGHLQDVSVILVYANLLLEQGDYGRLFGFFASETDISRASTDMAPGQLSDKPAEEVNLALLLQLARCRSDPDLQNANTIACIGFNFLQEQAVPDGVGTIEIFTTIYYSSDIITAFDFDFYASGWQKWVGHYRSLLNEGRHWELRDIVVAFVPAFGPVQTCTSLFKTDSLVAGVSKLVHEWAVASVDDETSRICLLDILVSICKGINFYLVDDSSFLEVASFAFKQARLVAASLKENDPGNIKCRSYLRWIVAETEHSKIVDGHWGKKGNLSYQFFRTFPGRKVWYGLEVLPMYAPMAAENPGWPVIDAESSETSLKCDELLKAALDAARELGDLTTQVACLNEMICRSHDPRSLFVDLDHLQYLEMGDKLGALRTRLNKYLLATRDGYRSELRRELIELDPELPIWNKFMHPAFEYVYSRVMYALLLAADGDSEESRITDSRADEMEKHFPDSFPDLKVPDPHRRLRTRVSPAQDATVEEPRLPREYYERRPASNGDVDIGQSGRGNAAERFARASQCDQEPTFSSHEVPRSGQETSKKISHNLVISQRKSLGEIERSGHVGG
ncbi:hypothetical protein CMQ_1309 [Grosmannia clavigera kw1407]|uniref:Uncharacterized protein n=1 Tax=Grosmannia clavigera (strain kw1407 / UAMH 11150) TaxID=655863 RepID=F0XDL8_GROCL|nr:uncharacterized protein CMQ_1309 [Grosmannia clavigera kw1407]EFX04381.1 hypothetical protein CMQ_1309 [Grosmannia clavigera kw1407]